MLGATVVRCVPRSGAAFDARVTRIVTGGSSRSRRLIAVITECEADPRAVGRKVEIRNAVSWRSAGWLDGQHSVDCFGHDGVVTVLSTLTGRELADLPVLVYRGSGPPVSVSAGSLLGDAGLEGGWLSLGARLADPYTFFHAHWREAWAANKLDTIAALLAITAAYGGVPCARAG